MIEILCRYEQRKQLAERQYKNKKKRRNLRFFCFEFRQNITWKHTFVLRKVVVIFFFERLVNSANSLALISLIFLCEVVIASNIAEQYLLFQLRIFQMSVCITNRFFLHVFCKCFCEVYPGLISDADKHK